MRHQIILEQWVVGLKWFKKQQVAGCNSGNDLLGSAAALQELSTFHPLVEFIGVDLIMWLILCPPMSNIWNIFQTYCQYMDVLG
jgi:hypothetical protein